MLRDAQYEKPSTAALWRPAMLLLVFAVLGCVLLWRAVDLQVLDKQFLQGQGDARHLRVVEIPAHRGVIADRNGEPLAISSPVSSVWVNPKEFIAGAADTARLARLLDLEPRLLERRIGERADREFLYIKRHVEPDLGEQVMALSLPGVALQHEYRRFYPAGEVTAHVVGFTDIDDRGQEGVELAYNDWLQGDPGAKRVVRDRYGRIVDDVESLREPSPGKPLRLSIDRRLQYLAYRELKAAAAEQRVRAASLVLLDVTTGEVLAMVNQPGYNPNNRAEINGQVARNRAVTDAYEPGSTIKVFSVAAALESGRFRPDSVIDTGRGYMQVGSYTIHDSRAYGKIDVSTLIQKSSNIGIAKIALELAPETIWNLYARLGFGMPVGTGFPGEAVGLMPSRPPQRPAERAALAYGYGLSVTPLQLASAYATIAADGVRRPVSFLALERAMAEEQVISPVAARQVRAMMETVVADGGTAPQARVPGYRVAGKTGTARKAAAGGYAEKAYLSYFAGFAPASKPRLAMVVVLDEPSAQYYYGGRVAAPVFSRVMGGALRLLNVPPDDLPGLGSYVASVGALR
ncbi:MAG TPA: penicillin-binding protein 2 [Gammaproteobacteria bacterium]|nr:penicillin-binding protein 2 [Gammaproteobacteria bacterium]